MTRRCIECWRDITCGGDFCGTDCAHAYYVRARDKLAPAHPDPIRELLAFMIARELGHVCRCGRPATVFADARCVAPVCDDCAAKVLDRTGAEDLPHAAAIRRLLTP